MKRSTRTFLALSLILVLLSATLIGRFQKNTNPFKESSGQGFDQIDKYYSQTIKWTNCFKNFDCGTFQVPIDYQDLNLGKFDIAVMRHKSKGATQNLVINPGGPGGSGIDYVYSFQEAFTKPLVKNFNIIGFDPRGVGESAPILCLSNQETDLLYSVDSYPNDPTELAKIKGDAQTFADKCSAANPNLSHYSTANTARDMDILRSILGDEKLNYLGKSYGSYLGTMFANLFPNHVGKFILDGAVDPTLDATKQTLQQAVGFDEAFKAFAEYCRKQSNCVLGNDEVKVMTSKLSELRAKPLPVGNRKLTESLATYGIAFGLYESDSGWPALQKALQDLFKGDGKALITMADAYTGRDANGEYQTNEAESLSVIMCNDFPPAKLDVAGTIKAAPLFGKYVAYSNLDCNYLPHGQYQLISSPIKSVDPALIVGTLNDPATPYIWAEQLSKILVGSRLISLNSEGHTGYNRGSNCVDQVVEKYLISGSIPAQNLSCRS